MPLHSLLVMLTECPMLPLPQSCKDHKCKEALKHDCEWLPKDLKCDDGGKHTVYVK